MEKSGVKTRSSDQTMLPAEANILLVTDSSLEEDSETDDQSYIPPEVYVLSCNVYISHIMHMVFIHHIDSIEFHLLSLEMIHASASYLIYESIMLIVSCHPVYLDNMYVNISSRLDTHHMLNYAIISC